MKLLAILTLTLAFTAAEAKTTRVKTYRKKSGTVVQTHRKTTPDHSKLNNWSHKGNVNPDTGAVGTKE